MNDDDALLNRALRWALIARPGMNIAEVRLEPGDGERWIVIDWTDGRHFGWHLDGCEWREPPPWNEHAHDRPALYDADDDPSQHILICPACDQAFDASDQDQALHHARRGHDPMPRN
jgi:hypothetical protein